MLPLPSSPQLDTSPHLDSPRAWSSGMPYLNIKTYLGFGDTLHSRLVLVSWLPPILILLMFIGSWGLQSWVRCECCEGPADKASSRPAGRFTKNHLIGHPRRHQGASASEGSSSVMPGSATMPAADLARLLHFGARLVLRVPCDTRVRAAFGWVTTSWGPMERFASAPQTTVCAARRRMGHQSSATAR